MKQRSYTKKGPGRMCNTSPSERTLEQGEVYGNKLSRKASRGHLTRKSV